MVERGGCIRWFRRSQRAQILCAHLPRIKGGAIVLLEAPILIRGQQHQPFAAMAGDRHRLSQRRFRNPPISFEEVAGRNRDIDYSGRQNIKIVKFIEFFNLLFKWLSKTIPI
jgi:hypothetical protein